MLSGIREICVVTTPHDLPLYRRLLKDGSQLGIELTYIEQARPEGLPQALILAEEFLNSEKCCLILGDNIFYGPTLGNDLRKNLDLVGCQIFAYQVADPHRYGVVSLLENGNISSLEEKPSQPKSNYAIPGLYYFDSLAATLAKTLTKSSRGEYEIIELLSKYQSLNALKVTILPRGTAWLDTGTPESLHDASSYVKAIQERQGLLVSSPEEVAFRNGWISATAINELANEIHGTSYSRVLLELAAYEH